MRRTLARDIVVSSPDAPVTGTTVRVEGWIHRRRTLASVTFVVIRDRTGLVQVVVKEPETFAIVERLGEETVVRVTAVVSANPSAPGGLELVEPRFEVLGDPAETPPVELWRPTLSAGLAAVLDHAPSHFGTPVARPSGGSPLRA